MALSFGTSVAVNNLLALKAFRTYLANYKQHEMPRGERPGFFKRLYERWVVSFVIKSLLNLKRQRLMVEVLKGLIEAQVVKTTKDLISDEEAKKASVSLNDVTPGMFAILYLIQNPGLLAEAHTAKAMLDVISQLELEFALIKKPREEMKYNAPGS